MNLAEGHVFRKNGRKRAAGGSCVSAISLRRLDLDGYEDGHKPPEKTYDKIHPSRWSH
jgi:hypothetical protein